MSDHIDRKSERRSRFDRKKSSRKYLPPKN